MGIQRDNYRNVRRADLRKRHFFPLFPGNYLTCSPVFPQTQGMTGKTLTQADKAERERIGATIRQVREMRGYKPDEFANEVGISRPYLANIEAGRKPLTEVLLGRIARKLDVRQIVIVRDGYFTPAQMDDAA